MLWILVTMFKACHVPNASRITTSGTIFTEKFFSVSKEWVRSWSNASLIIYDKTLAKKLKAVRPKSCREREKEKEKERRSLRVFHCMQTQKYWCSISENSLGKTLVAVISSSATSFWNQKCCFVSGLLTIKIIVIRLTLKSSFVILFSTVITPSQTMQNKHKKGVHLAWLLLDG